MSHPSRRVLRHVVLFAFKETATPTQLQAVEQAFAALPPQIAEIKGFEWGTDVSVEHWPMATRTASWSPSRASPTGTRTWSIPLTRHLSPGSNLT